MSWCRKSNEPFLQDAMAVLKDVPKEGTDESSPRLRDEAHVVRQQNGRRVTRIVEDPPLVPPARHERGGGLLDEPALVFKFHEGEVPGTSGNKAKEKDPAT